MWPDAQHVRQGPNWWVIGALTAAGAVLLAAAYSLPSYWQGVLVNVGTTLFLSAFLVFAESKLLHRLRAPGSLAEAVTRFSQLVTPLAPGVKSQDIKERVLRTIGQTGLYQHPPEDASARFVNLGGPVEVEWLVDWNEDGIRHTVTADGRAAPFRHISSVGWDKKFIVHEDRIFEILRSLLRELEPRDQG